MYRATVCVLGGQWSGFGLRREAVCCLDVLDVPIDDDDPYRQNGTEVRKKTTALLPKRKNPRVMINF